MGHPSAVSSACPNEELLAAYLDGELDAQASADVRAHIDGCSSCLGLLAEVVDGDAATEAPGKAPDALDEGTFDRYVVGRRLGAGAMGVVFEAFDPQLQRRVAIKLVRASPGPDRAREHARMLREAQAMARLSHPNLVPVLAVGTKGDDLYLVLELVQGTTLRAWLAAAPRPWRTVVRAYVAAGRGLAAAHAAGVVHRDFKPDNVLMSAAPDGVAARDDEASVAQRVRVIDFGLARLVDTHEPPLVAAVASGDDAERTGAGVMLGTPAYMPPEQRLHAAVDARADQFALAVSVWEGVFGERPFAGRSHAALHEAAERGELRRPATLARVPVRLRRTIERALSAKPEQRFADMTAFVDAMERSLRRRTGIVIAGAALGATVTATAVVLSGGTGLDCTPAIAPRWDEAARARLQDAFARTDDAIAGASATVLAALDRRALAWHDAHTRNCVAARAHESAAAVRTCLDVRRLELDAVVDVLADGNADVLARALPMVAGLPGVEPCERAPPQLATIDAEALVGEAQSMREQLARARALGEASRFDEAIATARVVLEHAMNIGHAAVHAEANARLGQIHVDASQPVEGAALLEEAFFEARELGHDEVATETSIALVSTIGGQLARLDEVAPWVEHAEAALQRWGSSALEAELEKAKGGVALRSGDAEAAIAHYTRTVEIWRASVDADDPRLADAIDAVGVANQAARHLDVALDHHERALAIRERAYGDVHPDVGYSLTNIARVMIDQGLEEPAIHHNEWVIAIDEAALGPEHLYTAVAHNNLGAAWGRLGEPAAALEQFEAARPGFERLGAEHPEHALVLVNIGQAAAELGDFAAAAEVLERALAIRERHFGLEHPLTLSAAALLGSVSVNLGGYARASTLYARALGGPAPPASYDAAGLVRLRLSLARSQLALGRRREASEALAKARAALAQLVPPPPAIVAEADRLARAITPS